MQALVLMHGNNIMLLLNLTDLTFPCYACMDRCKGYHICSCMAVNDFNFDTCLALSHLDAIGFKFLANFACESFLT